MPRVGVQFPDRVSGTGQVSVIQLRSDFVVFGLGKEPAKTQGLFKECQGDIV